MSATPGKILVRLPNWVGDVAMAVPLLRAVRAAAPRADIALAGKAPHADLLAGLPHFDRFIVLPPGAWAQARALRPERFDLAILCPNSFESALVARLSGAKRRVGYALQGRSPLLTDRVRLAWRGSASEGAEPAEWVRASAAGGGRWLRPIPMNRYYNGLLQPLGWADRGLQLELAVTPVDAAAASAFLAKHALDGADGEVAVLAPGAAFGPAKLWVEERWARLAEGLHARMGMRSVAVGGPAEAELLERIAAACKVPLATTARERATLGLTKALVARGRLLVSTDSGPRHIGAAFGLPTVVLMGPNHPGYSDTGHAPLSVVLQKPACWPCQSKACPLGHHECMESISVEKVLREADAVLASRSPAPPTIPG